MLEHLTPILPGAYLGMLGGGQLGRMFTQAAQAMGYKVCILDPDPFSPAGAIAEKHLQANFTDSAALKELAAICRAVSTEFENVPAQTLDELEALGVYVAPRSDSVSIAQNRIAEKTFLSTWKSAVNIGPVPYCVIENQAAIDALDENLLPGILKLARLGYDGKGQITVHSPVELKQAWHDFGRVPCVLEKHMDLAFEISALVARGCDDAVVVYPIAQNIHRNGILHTSTVPAPSLNPDQEKRVLQAAQNLIRHLNYVGILCIEFFVLKSGEIFANEIAPRPHNSGHYTMDASVTSQFQQQVRAMARLPLGDTRLLTPVSMLNLLGELWFTVGTENTVPQEPDWASALSHDSAKLHLYGKSVPLPGRKMGHINCLGTSPAEARQIAVAVASDLGIEP